MTNKISGADVSSALAWFMPSARNGIFSDGFWKSSAELAKEKRETEGSPVGKYAVYGAEWEFVKRVESETIHFLYFKKEDGSGHFRKLKTEIAFFIEEKDACEFQVRIARIFSHYRSTILDAKLALQRRLQEVEKDFRK